MLDTLMVYLNSCKDESKNSKEESRNDDSSSNEVETQMLSIEEMSSSSSISDESDEEDEYERSKRKAKEKTLFVKFGTFKGGTTKFYGSKEKNKVFLDASKTENTMITHEIRPSKGTAVIFNHDVWHEGCKVISGTKYILRTDIMFRRVEHGIESENVLTNPLFHQCEDLYQKSIELQKKGDPKGSTLAYLEALTIQAKLSSIDTKKRAQLRARTKGK